MLAICVALMLSTLYTLSRYTTRLVVMASMASPSPNTLPLCHVLCVFHEREREREGPSNTPYTCNEGESDPSSLVATRLLNLACFLINRLEVRVRSRRALHLHDLWC